MVSLRQYLQEHCDSIMRVSEIAMPPEVLFSSTATILGHPLLLGAPKLIPNHFESGNWGLRRLTLVQDRPKPAGVA